MTLAAAMRQQEATFRLPPVGLTLAPFTHAVLHDCLPSRVGAALLRWFEDTAPWQLVETDFYEQYEFNLLEVSPPASVDIFQSEMLANLSAAMGSLFDQRFCSMVKVVAHKLVPGQHIGIHNDYLPGEETHRLLIQLNHGLTDDQGGFFILFNSSSPNDVYQILRPRHLSGIVFEISPSSYHAVSRVHGGIRYTLVFSFQVAS